MDTKVKVRTRPSKHQKKPGKLLLIIVAVAVIVAVGVIINLPWKEWTSEPGEIDWLADIKMPDWVDVQIIDVNGSGRRGVKLEDLNDIVIHYVGNPGTTAQQNHDYYDQPDTNVSSHFLVGLDGEIIQCVPIDEKSSATNDRNRDTISIEVCHPDETGKFNDASYNSAIKLTAWLCVQTGLDETHVIRHYDVTGKLCPLYYVEHEDAWEQFKNDVASAIEAKDW